MSLAATILSIRVNPCAGSFHLRVGVQLHLVSHFQHRLPQAAVVDHLSHSAKLADALAHALNVPAHATLNWRRSARFLLFRLRHAGFASLLLTRHEAGRAASGRSGLKADTMLTPAMGRLWPVGVENGHSRTRR